MEEKIYTTYEVSKFCKADISTVTDWITRGMLSAYKTPGGHRRVKEKELKGFLEKYSLPVPEELKRGDKKRILIVDDEASIRKIIIRAINKAKLDVETEIACDGFEAGSQVANFKPDIVILDIKLPGVDGFKVCEQIKSNNATQDIKIIAITGYPSEEIKKRILNCGAADFISKPFVLDELIDKINAQLGIAKPK